MLGLNARSGDAAGCQPWRYRATIALISTLCLAVVGHDLLRTWEDRSHQLDSSRRETANLAWAADQHAEVAFRDVDARLAALVERLEAAGPMQLDGLRQVLARAAAHLPEVDGLGVVDETGILIVNSRSKTRQANVADRSYFVYHQTHTDHRAYVSETLQARASGESIISISLRVDRPDGGFAGVVVASIASAYFQNFYATFDLGRDGLVALLRDDGSLLVRQPFVASAVGTTRPIFRLFRDTLTKAPAGTFEATSALDGVLRIYSYRRLAGYPLVVIGSLGKDEQLAAWRTGAAEHLFATVVTTVLLGFISVRVVMETQRLGRSEERFRRLVEAMPNAMVKVNAAGRIVMINAETERLFGYTRSELIGAPIEMLLPADMRAEHPGLRSSFFSNPTTRPMGRGRALFVLKKNGSKVEVEIGLSPIESDDGRMVLSTIVDISSRVRLEGQVRQSQKMHAIGRVIAGVAHDFNNVLQALSGALENLLDDVADRPKAIEWANVALRAATHGEELTDRLLSFSRQRILTVQPIRINTLFSGLKELINHLFEANLAARTTLEMMPCPPGLAVLADLAQLQAALINLAVNAHDAMSSGGCLRISAYEADSDSAIVPPGRYTVISVADTGSGMDVGTLAQAFDPFFTTKGANGTGLGLSMVQGFARQSGGDVQITSVVGEGTTIDLWLPSASVSSEVVPPVATLTRTGGRILLVDDSEDALVVVAAFLRFAGMEVTSRMSGDLALAELAGGNRFDAIITDFAMPGMNGVELLALAREIDPSMSAMIITGFSDPKLLTMINGVVTLRKPFNRSELAKTVHELLAAKCALEPASPA
jgi:PAS domain S-box-containing protein